MRGSSVGRDEEDDEEEEEAGTGMLLGVKTVGASCSSYIACFLISASERKLVNPRLVEFTHVALASRMDR